VANKKFIQTLFVTVLKVKNRTNHINIFLNFILELFMIKFLSILLVSFLLAIGVNLAQGQPGLFDKLYVGPTLGYTYVLGGSFGFGARGEYGLLDNVEIGSFKGAIGVGAEISYSGRSESYYEWEWKYTLIGFLAYGSYHFSPHNNFDPYIRLGLGYNNVSASWNGPFGNAYSAGYSSGVGIDGSIGFDYHLSDNMKFRADLGYPFLLAVGIDFSLGQMGWQKKSGK
jgi:hypothetical protein